MSRVEIDSRGVSGRSATRSLPRTEQGPKGLGRDRGHTCAGLRLFHFKGDDVLPDEADRLEVALSVEGHREQAIAADVDLDAYLSCRGGLSTKSSGHLR